MNLDTMPLTETASISYILLSSVTTATVSLLASSSPGTEDAWSVIGAMFAGCISVMHAMSSKRSRLDLICVLIASAFCGAIAPGVLIRVYYPALVESFTWHSWAGLGFVAGLAGWSLTRFLILFFESGIWTKLFKRHGVFDDSDKTNDKNV